MRTKRNLPIPFLLFTAALVVLVAVVAVIDRANRPRPVGQAEGGAGLPDLSRAMTFTPPVEPKP